MVDVGIDLPNDILSYLILFKFPPSLHSLHQQIMHSNKIVTMDLVLNHPTQLENKTKVKSKETKLSNTALISSHPPKKPVPAEFRCRRGYHNPQSPNHPKSKCWHLHEHIAPDWWKESQAQWRAQLNTHSKAKEVAHYVALLTTWIKEVNPLNKIIINSGASCHMFNSPLFFSQLNHLSSDDFINTGKEGARLSIKGKGVVKFSWKGSSVTLSNCLYVTNLVVNLISPGKMISSKNCLLTSSKNQFYLFSESKLVFYGFIQENLFILNPPS